MLGVAGSIAGLFIHAVLCLQAIIYKRAMENGEGAFEIVDGILEGVYKAILVPFFLLYAVLMVATICVSVAVGCGVLGCPAWMWPLNSVAFLIVGALFRKANPVLFQDLPGIIMPSLGLAMVGLVGVVALLA